MQLVRVSQDDHIVVVMGPTGSGKSTFIATATGQGHEAIGHGLRTVTSDIRIVKAKHPNYGHSVVFVDTPGFDDTCKSDTETLSQIAHWLVKTYKSNVNLAAVIYLHRISDNRMAGSLLKNLQMFESLCGRKAMSNVIIATTMWDEVKEEVGARREAELHRDFWQEMIVNGCRTARFDLTSKSAWDIVGKNPGTTLLLQEEMVDGGKSLDETEAYDVLNDGWPRWLADFWRRAFRKSR